MGSGGGGGVGNSDGMMAKKEILFLAIKELMIYGIR